MLHPSTEYSQSRPFKIFISLLDKWEIGSLLTEALVLDAFKAIKKGIDSGEDPGEDVRAYRIMLYFIFVEPCTDDDDGEYLVRGCRAPCVVETTLEGRIRGHFRGHRLLRGTCSFL